MPGPGPVVLYRLPDPLRARLKEPLGPVVDEEALAATAREGRLGRPLACVGDIVCATALRLGLDPELLVYDLATQRGPVPDPVRRALTSHPAPRVHVVNPAGTVTKELDDAVRDALAGRGKRTRIEVEGEEDLAGLPVLVHAPMGATMIYGMPDRGLVPVPVTHESRAVAAGLLSLMKVGPAPRGRPTEGG